MKKFNIQLEIKKNPRQVAIILAVLSLVALFLYINLSLKPQVMRVSGVIIKEKTVKADLRDAEREIANMEKYKGDIGSYKAKIERYEKILPVEQEIPKLLEELSNKAKNANVKIVGITPVVATEERAKAGETYQEIPIIISAKSGYHELGRFLASLSTSDRYMKVVDIEIRSNRSSPKKHDVELVVVTYVLLKGKV